jgi:peptidoglycan/LPS O-acetylase OafA/YrhL
MSVPSPPPPHHPISLPTEQHATRRATYGHDNNFDVMRFAMAVLVIFSHCFACTLGGGDDHEPLNRLTGGRVSSGGLAVDVFFVISGFLITASWERSRSALPYFRKRVLRIYPAFVVATVVGVCAIGPLAGRTARPLLSRPVVVGLVRSAVTFEEPRYPGAFAANPLPNAINSPVWTIRWEFACYGMVAALGVVGLLRWRSVVLVALLGVTIAYAMELPLRMPSFVGGPGYVAKHWARLPAFYLVGVTLYLYRDRVPIHAGLAGICAALLAASLVFPRLLTASLVLAGGYLVIWIAYQRWARLPRFAKYGDFSYGIYLYGFPIQQSLVAILGARLTPASLFVTATPLAVLAGAASWYGVERWFVRPKTARPS